MRIFCPADRHDVEYAVKSFLSDGKPTYIRLGKAQGGAESTQNRLKKSKNFSQLGAGNNLIFCHGSISYELLNHNLFDENVHKVILVNEVTDIESIYNQIVDVNTKTISVLEEVVFPGSLGSRISRIISVSGSGVAFNWMGIDSSIIPTFGGSEDFLRSYFFGENYLNKIFNLS